MLTIAEHQQIARDLLIAVNHADSPAIENTLARLFGPGTDERDGYVIASGLLGGIASKIRPSGGVHPPVHLHVMQWTPDGAVPADVDQAPPVVRATSRSLVAYLNGDRETGWAVWTSVLSGGAQAVVEYLAALAMQAAAMGPCPCEERPR